MVNESTLVGQVRNLLFKDVRPGSCYHQFQVGTLREWADENGRRRRTIDWVNVIAWNKAWLTSAIQDGDLVFVSGRIQSRQIHKDEATGKVFYRTEVVAADIRNVTNFQKFVARGDQAGGEFGDSQNDFGL